MEYEIISRNLRTTLFYLPILDHSQRKPGDVIALHCGFNEFIDSLSDYVIAQPFRTCVCVDTNDNKKAKG